MSTKKKKTKEEMLDYICQTKVKEAKTQKTANLAHALEKLDEWYESGKSTLNAIPMLGASDDAYDEELINQIEYGLYAIIADANMLMKMLDKLRAQNRENAK
jgi:hypothetical protein